MCWTRDSWIWTRNSWIWTSDSWIWTRNSWISTRNSWIWTHNSYIWTRNPQLVTYFSTQLCLIFMNLSLSGRKLPWFEQWFKRWNISLKQHWIISFEKWISAKEKWFQTNGGQYWRTFSDCPLIRMSEVATYEYLESC